MTHDSDTAQATSGLGGLRLILGFAQGVAWFLLYTARVTGSWPANDPWVIGVLSLATAFLVPTILVGVGQMRPATLAAWIASVIAFISFAVWHSIARQGAPGAAMSGEIAGLIAIVLFVAYHLAAAADADRRFVARYETYFDVAWKNGVQLSLSLAFVGALWLLLYLGAALFSLIKIEAVRELIQEEWFAYPVTTTMFALAVHVTDVRVGLINGIRAVALALLSWLLPVMTFLGAAFLLTLPAVGLAPLWATGSATALLLGAAATLVILINAAYQSGEHERTHKALELSARVAGAVLVPLVAIAAYAVWLRVEQHGLTPERVTALAILAIAACYAGGYGLAAVLPGRWFKALESTNVLAAVVVVVIIVAGLSPAGDPARLSVNDQLRRLQAGLETPETFDYSFLRFESARYGRDALKALAEDKSNPRAQAIAARAEAALKSDSAVPAVKETPQREYMARIEVRPKGSALPESFATQNWPGTAVSPQRCAQEPCRAHLLDLDGDAKAEILLEHPSQIDVYQASPTGAWRSIGYFYTTQCGTHLPTFLESGPLQVVPPKMGELSVNGMRLRLQGCPG